MATPTGWITTKPLCGVGDPLGREDSANKYLRGFYRNYRVGHKADASHKSGIYDIDFVRMETIDYSGTSAEQTIYLTNSNLLIQSIKIVGDAAEWPVISQKDLYNTSLEAYNTSQPSVQCFEIYGGNLYAGTTNTGGIYVYDGSSWSLAYDSTEDYIYALCEYNGNLYAGTGSYGKILVYNGSSWSDSYDSTENRIMSFAEYNGNLYAGSGTGGKIYEYNGSSWSESYDSTATDIYALAVYDGNLYAGSSIQGKVFVYNGSTWSEAYDSPGDVIGALKVYDGKLYAGGDDKIYVYDGISWAETSGIDGYTDSLGIYRNKLYAGVRAATETKLYVHDGSSWVEYVTLSSGTVTWDIIECNRIMYAGTNTGRIFECGQGSKKLNTNEFVLDHVLDISIPGQFTLGADDAVNKLSDTYHCTVLGVVA